MTSAAQYRTGQCASNFGGLNHYYKLPSKELLYNKIGYLHV